MNLLTFDKNEEFENQARVNASFKRQADMNTKLCQGKPSKILAK